MKGLSNFMDSALSRVEMKNVVGGGSCAVYLPPGWSSKKSFSWSGNVVTRYQNGSYTIDGLNLSTVNKFMSGGGRWCCDNCGTASWMGGHGKLF